MSSPFVNLQEWWTATEVAASGLPDLPTTQKGVGAQSKRLQWRNHPQFARRRDGRGGGWEYHWKLFPSRAQAALLKAARPAPAPETRPDRGEAWAQYDSLPQDVKDKALYRLGVIQKVEELAPIMTKDGAARKIARDEGIGFRTIWNWFSMVEFVDAADRLPYLAPRHRFGRKAVKKATASPEFFTYLKGAFLQLEGPTFAQSYRQVTKICKAKGWECLEERTARRWLDANVPVLDQVYAREGLSGLRRRFPPQIRDRSHMVSMEMLNADCHKIDVFVRWPGLKHVVRPQLIVFQDIYSGKILAWEIDLNPNKVAVMQAFMKVLRDYGIPKGCLFDNGMEFANKDITGGAKSRFRFKISEAEPSGILQMLGIDVTFATPGHGQAKPIERAFRDVASDIAKDPRFAGAYVGHRPDAKPENYMSRAIELADFIEVVEEGLLEHNARIGRRSHTANGRSFDETFAESYASTPIRKATEEQMRLCLMAMYVRKLHAKNGQITLYNNLYWAEWMSAFAGQKMTARFNPEDLHEGAYIYNMAGEFLGYAPCREKSPFRDIASARALARENSRRVKEAKARLASVRPTTARDLAAALSALPKPDPSLPEATVVQLDRLAQIEQRRRSGGLIERTLPVPEQNADIEARREAMVVEFRTTSKPEEPQETARDRFQRALKIEAREQAGDWVGQAEADWLGRYQNTPEYRSRKSIWEEQDGQFAG